MGTLSYTDLPVAGQPEDVNQLLTTFTEISTVINGGIDATNITNASVTDTELASPNNATYKTIMRVTGLGSDALAIGPTPWMFQGSGLNPSGLSSSTPPHLIYFDDADYTVANMTQRLRIRAQVLVNATSPGATTFTFGLHEVTSVAGSADQIACTLNNTPVSGSTVAFASPVANTRYQNNSGDFTIPSDGYYVLAIVMSAGVTTDSAQVLSAQLQTRNT